MQRVSIGVQVPAVFAALVLALLAPWCGARLTAPILWRQVPTFAPDQATFTDDEVRQAVYSGRRWPSDFYHETGYRVAPFYVNTLSIHAVMSPPYRWIELSTDDVAVARAWAESTVAYTTNAIPAALEPAVVTDRYIEFSRDRPNAVPLRAHRASYLDRSSYDRFSPDSLIGVLEVVPVDAAAVRGVAEYLWYLDHRELGDCPALTSFTAADGEVVVHVIYDVLTEHFEYCEGLHLQRLEYRVSRATGAIVLRTLPIRTVRGSCR